MRAKTYTVPFREIVGPDALELEFDPATDYLVVRSIYADPVEKVGEFRERLRSINPDTTEEEAVAVTLDLIDRTVVEWHLIGESGTPIPKPVKGEDFEVLPGAIKSSLFPFLLSFRGRPDPTPAE